jgi:plastocyanin
MTTRRFAQLFAGVVLGASLTALATGCANQKPEVTPSDPDAKPAVVVKAVDNAYEPKDVAVEKGDAVQWTFEGSDQHDVVAEDGSFVSELQTEGSFTHVFDEAGTFDYDCSIHPEMTGSVTVK